jgi:DNA-binding NarL/FixJ family response regulator
LPAEDVRILREALVAVLNLADDIEVVAAVETGDAIVPAALRTSPDVAVLDIEPDTGRRPRLCHWPSGGRRDLDPRLDRPRPHSFAARRGRPGDQPHRRPATLDNPGGLHDRPGQPGVRPVSVLRHLGLDLLQRAGGWGIPH